MLDSKRLDYDPIQSSFVEELNLLQSALESYEPIWYMIRNKFLNPLSKEKVIKTNIPETSPCPKQSRGLMSFFVGLSDDESNISENESLSVINLDPNEKLIDDMQTHKPFGLYVWGGPGCGKTFLIDLMYQLLDVKYKQRMHFNEFMLRVHQKNFKNSKVMFKPIYKIINKTRIKKILTVFY